MNKLVFILLMVGAQAQGETCAFTSMKAEAKGEERIFSRCRSESDCEVFAAFSKKDLKDYENLVSAKNRTLTTLSVLATLSGGGIAMQTTRAGGVVLTFAKSSFAAFKSPLSSPQLPAAGMLKSIIAKEYGAKTAEIFSRSTYISMATGMGSLTVPNVRESISDTISFVVNPAHEKVNPVVTGQAQPGDNGCQDDEVKQIADLKNRVELDQHNMQMLDTCNAMPAGGQKALCLENAEKTRQAQRRAPSEERIRQLLGPAPGAPKVPSAPAVPRPRPPADSPALIGDGQIAR